MSQSARLARRRLVPAVAQAALRARSIPARPAAARAAWEGHSEQTIDHLREAARLASDLGLLGEQWQIQVVLGRAYEAAGLPAQARTAFGEAARIIQGLAEGIKNETLRTRFLAGSQVQRVVQHAQSEASAFSKDQP